MNNYTPKNELEARVLEALAGSIREGAGPDEAMARAAGTMVAAVITVLAELRDAVLDGARQIRDLRVRQTLALEDLEHRGDGIQGELEELVRALAGPSPLELGNDDDPGAIPGVVRALELLDGSAHDLVGELVEALQDEGVRRGKALYHIADTLERGDPTVAMEEADLDVAPAERLDEWHETAGWFREAIEQEWADRDDPGPGEASEEEWEEGPDRRFLRCSSCGARFNAVGLRVGEDCPTGCGGDVYVDVEPDGPEDRIERARRQAGQEEGPEYKRLLPPGGGSREDGIELASHLRALRDAIAAQTRQLPRNWDAEYQSLTAPLGSWLGARIAEADAALQARRDVR